MRDVRLLGLFTVGNLYGFFSILNFILVRLLEEPPLILLL
jgi:hypothetical protein